MTESHRPGEAESVKEFMIRCLEAGWNPAALDTVRDFVARTALDWDAVRKAARTERISPLLYTLIRGQNVVPPSLEEDWRRSYVLHLSYNTRLFRRFEDAVDALRARDLSVMLLKGVALVQTVHADPGVRPMADMDLLIPASEVGCAQSVMADLGYEPNDDEWPGFSRRYRNFIAYEWPVDPRHIVLIGLHWHVLIIPYYERIPVDDWFSRACPVSLGEVQALVPAPEDHLLHLCAHFALHHQYDLAMFRCYDMAKLIHHSGSTLDWDGLAQRAVDWHLVLPLQRTLGKLEGLWPGLLPLGVTQKTESLQPTRGERMIHALAADHPPTPTSDMLLKFGTMPGLWRRIRYLLEMAVPSPLYMRKTYGRGPWGLWPLLYFTRMGSGLRHVFP